MSSDALTSMRMPHTLRVCSTPPRILIAFSSAFLSPIALMMNGAADRTLLTDNVGPAHLISDVSINR